MLDHEDLKWIATTSTELNTMLQQIARYADLARQHKGDYSYLEMLGERVELASRSAQDLFDRVTSAILAGSSTSAPRAKTKTPAPFTVMPPLSPSVAAMGQAVAKKTPKAKAPPPPAPAPLDLPADLRIVNENGARELILLVDDEVEISELAAEMLADVGYKVILAKDGFEALKIYQQIGPQIGLVILDFFLPVMDGDAVFDELRALNPQINVVLSSGFAEQTKLGAMLAQGLRGFIPKPYTRDKLLEQVRSTLDAARQQTR
ncbi:MAG TPA: response regulator [Chthoniobacterales bacterium]|nr:response regulator [Chthoniobacterales bacterium]